MLSTQVRKITGSAWIMTLVWQPPSAWGVGG